MPADTPAEVCPRCDRIECPVLAVVVPPYRTPHTNNWFALSEEDRAAVQAYHSQRIPAEADCAAHAVDWRARALAERSAREAAEAIAHAAIDGIEILNQKAASIVADAHAIGLVSGADMAEMLAAVERSKAAASQLRAALSPEKETP